MYISFLIYLLKIINYHLRYGVTANITAFHAVARGSIPRTGSLFLLDLRPVRSVILTAPVTRPTNNFLIFVNAMLQKP